MFWSFCNQQSNNLSDRRAGNRASEFEKGPAQELLSRQVVLLDVDYERVQLGYYKTLHYGLEQFFFSFEIEIKEALANASPFGDFLNACSGIALFDKRREGGLGDFLRSFFLTPLIAGLSSVLSRY